MIFHFKIKLKVWEMDNSQLVSAQIKPNDKHVILITTF